MRCWKRWLWPAYGVWLWISRLFSRVTRSIQNPLHPDLARKVRWRLRHERLPWMVTCADKWAVMAWAA